MKDRAPAWSGSGQMPAFYGSQSSLKGPQSRSMRKIRQTNVTAREMRCSDIGKAHQQTTITNLFGDPGHARHHSAHRFSHVAPRRCPRLAAQPVVGLRPQRWLRTHSDHRPHLGFDGTNLASVDWLLIPAVAARPGTHARWQLGCYRRRDSRRWCCWRSSRSFPNTS